MAMASKLIGGCLCGKVRYTVNAVPFLAVVCHCKNCQKQAGTAFSVVLAVPKSAFSMTGALKTYIDRGESGKSVGRNFCPDCGSPVTTTVEARPDAVFIKAGTLDDASEIKPTKEIWCQSAQPWVDLQGLQRFEKAFG